MLANKLAGSGVADKLYVDDVFSTYLYTGNGGTQTINNGIDLAGQGGLVWIKRRDNAIYNHMLFDSSRPLNYAIRTNLTNPNTSYSGAISSLNANGFSLGNGTETNVSSGLYISYTFRKAPKFFDVVTYAGDGVAGRQIPHALGIAPGMIIFKRTDTTSSYGWWVHHRSLATNKGLLLNTTGAEQETTGMLNITSPTDTVFTVGTLSDVNANAGTYVAYLFAHDTSADGIIQCGSFTTDGSGNATVNHGWTAGVQFAMIKARSTTGDWEMYDTARTVGWTGNDARLRANLSNAEDVVTRLSASGTSVSFAGLSASSTYVYVFIVAPT